MEIIIWEKNFVVVSSVDGEYFKAEVKGGIELETILSVGYSSINGSMEEYEIDSKKQIAEAVSAKWEQADKPEFVDDKFLPILYQLVVTASSAYSNWLWRRPNA